MALFGMKSLAQNHVLEDAEADYRTSVRVEQFRVSDKAIYFPAFPGNQYIPFEAMSQIKVRNTAISVTGTCGKQLPMVCLRTFYDGEFYKDFLFEKRMSWKRHWSVSGPAGRIFRWTCASRSRDSDSP